MTFKNHRGEMAWYVIGIILAIIVLLVCIAVVFRINSASGQAGDVTKSTCETIFKGKCITPSDTAKPACTNGAQRYFGASCADNTQICCSE